MFFYLNSFFRCVIDCKCHSPNTLRASTGSEPCQVLKKLSDSRCASAKVEFMSGEIGLIGPVVTTRTRAQETTFASAADA